VRAFAAVLVVAAFLAAPAWAAPAPAWTVDRPASKVAFSSSFDGGAFTGGFPRRGPAHRF